jgi:outer membrane protein assembly factor BamD
MKSLQLLVLLSSLVLSGCSFFSKPEIKTEESWTADRVYSEAKAALNVSDYATAIKYYEQIETRFPFGAYAQQALLDSAYANYKLDESDIAIATLDRFLRVYPLNPNIDYAYYLRGLINANRDMGLVARYIPRDESQRNPASARAALKDFTTLVNRFPNSKYTDDATQRIVHLRNRLAQHEINIATYYMRRNSFLAAANRGRYVVENYARTPAVPDALLVMARAYKVLGIHDLSADALRVLKHNYPGHTGIAEIEQIQLIPVK